MQRCDQCRMPAAQAPALPTGTNTSRLCPRCSRRSNFGFTPIPKPFYPRRQNRSIVPARVAKP